MKTVLFKHFPWQSGIIGIVNQDFLLFNKKYALIATTSIGVSIFPEASPQIFLGIVPTGTLGLAFGPRFGGFCIFPFQTFKRLPFQLWSFCIRLTYSAIPVCAWESCGSSQLVQIHSSMIISNLKFFRSNLANKVRSSNNKLEDMDVLDKYIAHFFAIAQSKPWFS